MRVQDCELSGYCSLLSSKGTTQEEETEWGTEMRDTYRGERFERREVPLLEEGGDLTA